MRDRRPCPPIRPRARPDDPPRAGAGAGLVIHSIYSGHWFWGAPLVHPLASHGTLALPAARVAARSDRLSAVQTSVQWPHTSQLQNALYDVSNLMPVQAKVPRAPQLVHTDIPSRARAASISSKWEGSPSWSRGSHRLQAGLSNDSIFPPKPDSPSENAADEGRTSEGETAAQMATRETRTYRSERSMSHR